MIPSRIFGIETEYGLLSPTLDAQSAPLDPEAAAQELFAPIVAQTRSTNTFLSNGARLYLDVGAHPEYATAECSTLEDLLANDRAGELLFADLAEQANTHLREQGSSAQIHLVKNNEDSQGNSFGCHENYLVRRRPDYRARIESMLAFFVTRHIVTGAGHINHGQNTFDVASSHTNIRLESKSGTATAHEPYFEFSQRAQHMFDAISSASTRSRPMINTRDEPHGDAQLYRRMHVIVGDSNISQVSSAIKITATDMLLTLVEEGAILPHIQLADAVDAIRKASMDLSAKDGLLLSGGRQASAHDIQKRYFDCAHAYYDAHGYLDELSPVQTYAWQMWGYALDCLTRGEIEPLSRDLDWAAKYTLLQRYRERSGVRLDDPRVLRLDLAYHDITHGGLRAKMEAQGLLKVLVSEEFCQQAKTQAPQNTRARLRGAFVAKARELRQDFMVDWTNLRLLESQSEGPWSVVLSDPFASVDERVDELMEKMR